MIKKISRYTLQQIFIESLEECDSFKIIDGLNPFHIMLNGKELYIYIKNLSPAYFTNPDVWRVQLPKKEEFETIKEGNIDFVLLGYDADNDVYTTWHPKWTKQRLNNGESVSFYSRLSLQEEVASSQDIKRLSLNNDGEVIAFPREHLEFILSNLKTFFQDDSDYVAMGSKRRPEANDAYKTFCDAKNVELLARSMNDDGYSGVTIGNYCRAIKTLINDGHITRYRKIFLSCDSLSEYLDVVSEFCNQPDIKEQNEKWHNTLSAALRAYISFLIKQLKDGMFTSPTIEPVSIIPEDTEISSIIIADNNIPEEVDWEAMFTNANGKLTKIANPILIDKLRPYLDSEYVNPVCAYSEVEDFYGERYSTMDMSDWMKLFKAIDWNNPYVSLSTSKENKSTEKTKSKTEILRVEYPDGQVVQYQKSIDTFVEVIENNYPDLIHELNIMHANVNLVTKERSQQYSSAQREIEGGWLVFTNISTRKKREDLIKISDELELDLKVDLVSVVTGEIVILEDEPCSSTRQKIRVTFPNGRVIQPRKVLEALVEVVKYAGPEKVKELNIIVCSGNLILETPHPKYVNACKPVGFNCYVNTCSSTSMKYEQIIQISDGLNLNLDVDIVDGVEKVQVCGYNNLAYNDTKLASENQVSYNSGNGVISLEDCCRWIENLRTFKVNGISGPHKPVYLLTIIKLISEGVIGDKIYLNDILINTFKYVWNEVVSIPNTFIADICNPYIHMASEPYYKLHMLQSNISHLDIKKNINAIREACDYAIIDSQLVEIVKESGNAAIICDYICDFYNLKRLCLI